MLLPNRWRRSLLVAHIAVSVGWLGAVAAYLVLDVTVATSEDPATLRAAYISMGRITSGAIVPLAWAALVTGVIIAVGTKWGLIRHWWVVFSLVLTVFAVLVLMTETLTIDALARTAANPSTTDEELRALANTLLHSVLGAVVLVVILVLNIVKPRGMTRYGWRKQQEPPRRRDDDAEQDAPAERPATVR